MKWFKRITVLLFITLAISAFLITTKEVRADDEPTITMTEGAAIRTANPAGLRFTASVSGNFGLETEYGIAFVRGEKSKAEMINRFEAGTTGNVILNPSAGEMSASVVNIPVEAFTNDITALAYAIDGGTKYYSSNVVTRNIYEIAKMTYDGGFSNDFIEDILGEYHEVTYHYNGPLIGYASLAEMEADFIADFNATTGKSLVNAGAIYNSAGTGFATFFNDPVMNAKWVWLVDGLEALRKQGYGNHSICTTAYAHAKAMAMEETLDDNIVFRQNIQGYFTRSRVATYSGLAAINFGLVEVREQMFSTMRESFVVRNNSSLLTNPSRTGYSFDGWFTNSTCTTPAVNVGESITDIYAKWSLEFYSVTYMDGENVLDLGSDYYDYLTTLNLPNYVKGGYSFDGWYDNPSFLGDPITSIPAFSSTGDKVFYAKTTKTSNEAVNVVLNTNGGLLPKEYANFNPLYTFNVTTYSNTGNASGIYLCSNAVVSNNSLRWQYKILLKYISAIDAYEIVATDAAKKSANATAEDAGVTWTHALASSSTDMTNQVFVGQIISLSVDEISLNMDSFEAYVERLSAYQESDELVLTLETALPTPYREGYTFLGWRNSQTGLLETSFPGYLVNPGDITYTAEWEAN